MHTANKNNHNDDLFRATVVLPTAMTYSVGSSSSMSDSMDSLTGDNSDLDPNFNIDDNTEIIKPDFPMPTIDNTSIDLQKELDIKKQLLNNNVLKYKILKDINSGLLNDKVVNKEVANEISKVVPVMSDVIAIESYTEKPTSINYNKTLEYLGYCIASEDINNLSLADSFIEGIEEYLTRLDYQTYTDAVTDAINSTTDLINKHGEMFKKVISSKNSLFSLKVNNSQDPQSKEDSEVNYETTTIDLLKDPISKITNYTTYQNTDKLTTRSKEAIDKYGIDLSRLLENPDNVILHTGVRTLISDTLCFNNEKLEEISFLDLIRMYLGSQLLTTVVNSGEKYQKTRISLYKSLDEYRNLKRPNKLLIGEEVNLSNTEILDLFLSKNGIIMFDRINDIANSYSGLKGLLLLNYYLDKLHPLFNNCL